jgi:outer membrane protein assembly factor BamE (lipoprotein component of BamABCDE complex)
MRHVLNAGLLACFLTAVAASGCQSTGEVAFDAAKWRAAAGEDTTERTTRGQMAQALLEKVLFVGQARSEVVALLGEPNQRSDGHGDAFVYYLGRGQSLLPSIEFLVVRFEHDRVTKIHIAQD